MKTERERWVEAAKQLGADAGAMVRCPRCEKLDREPQLELDLRRKTWGGARKGAGRKKTGRLAQRPAECPDHAS